MVSISKYHAKMQEINQLLSNDILMFRYHITMYAVLSAVRNNRHVTNIDYEISHENVDGSYTSYVIHATAKAFNYEQVKANIMDKFY